MKRAVRFWDHLNYDIAAFFTRLESQSGFSPAKNPVDALTDPLSNIPFPFMKPIHPISFPFLRRFRSGERAFRTRF
jgi:hypothetical protein